MKKKIALGIVIFWILVALVAIVYFVGWDVIFAILGVIIFWVSIYWAIDNF